MVMEDTESCNYSPVVSSMSSTHNWKHQCCKLQVFTEVFRRLKESGHAETDNPEFEDDLWNHFHRLPLRYALDVNVDRAEDVIRHKRLLSLANNPAKTPVFDVRLIQVSSVDDGKSDWLPPQSLRKDIEDSTCYIGRERKMYEVTVSTDDKPKLLSQLTALLGEVGLNIQEAHAFSTVDGYSLDVFVVDGWPLQETEQLRKALEYEIAEIQRGTLSKGQGIPLLNEQVKNDAEPILGPIKIPADKTDVWEIDLELLKFDSKVAAGTSGDLYRGDYCGQDVAIKVFKRELVNASMQREFSQEVSIMRKVRHKNVVKFIGACTKPPSLCIVTEFMLGGSVYDFLHKRRGIFKLPALLKVAIDVSKGMNYLHQNNIIHRDLKTANLLMDDNEVVKVADFGVARVICHSGVMTAETGTYRWMAPEVIEHKPYDHKADVFSFGIVLWELLTGKIPYEYLTPLQAAVGVVHKGLRPDIPQNAHPKLMELIQQCWHLDPSMRPEFSEIIVILQLIAEEIEEDDAWNEDDAAVGGFLSAFWQTLTGGL